MITEDLVNFFRGDDLYFQKPEFKKIIKLYPSDVKNNLKQYLILTELLRFSQGFSNKIFSERRIKNLLKSNNNLSPLSKSNQSQKVNNSTQNSSSN